MTIITILYYIQKYVLSIIQITEDMKVCSKKSIHVHDQDYSTIDSFYMYYIILITGKIWQMFEIKFEYIREYP